MNSRALVGAALVLVAVLTGCSSDSDDGPSGSGRSSSTGSTASPDPNSPTTPATPEVEPATGPPIVLEDLGTPVLRLRLPDDLEWTLRGGGDSASAVYPDGTFADVETLSAGVVDGKPFGYYADPTAETLEISGPRLRRLDDRTVQGVEGFVLEGKDDEGLTYVFGTVHAGASAVVIFTIPGGEDQARDRIESVLASAEWL